MRAIISKKRTLILYGFIGVSGAVLDFLVYAIFVNYLKINPSIASFLSVSLGIVNNFILNSFYNFKVNDYLFRRFISFYLIGIIGAIISSFMILVLYNLMHVNAMTSKIITIIPIVLLQYIINKKTSFKADN